MNFHVLLLLESHKSIVSCIVMLCHSICCWLTTIQADGYQGPMLSLLVGSENSSPILFAYEINLSHLWSYLLGLPASCLDTRGLSLLFINMRGPFMSVKWGNIIFETFTIIINNCYPISLHFKFLRFCFNMLISEKVIWNGPFSYG